MKSQYVRYPLVKGNIEKVFRIGTLLPEHETGRLIECLRKNCDVFAWEASEMPGIDRKVIEHKIPTNPLMKPVQQKVRRIGGEKLEAEV